MSGFGRQLTNPAESDPLNVKVQATLDGTLDELPNSFEFWQAPQVKEAIEGLQRADKVQQDQAVSIENGKAFVAGHPEFINTEANIALMNDRLLLLFGQKAYSVADYEQAYASLRASGFLKLDRTVLAAQEKQAAKQRYEAHQRASVMPSEDEMYRLPMEELERRARGF